MELLAVCGAVILFFWVRAVMKRGAVAQVHRAHRENDFQRASEMRALDLMHEFPALLDGEIAMLMRDELVNRGERDPLFLSWATEETVSRMRRTLIIELERRRREQKLRR